MKVTKRQERISKEQAMARLLNREIVIYAFQREFRGDLIDWDNEKITIQYKISDEPVFQLRTFERKFCNFKLANPIPQSLNKKLVIQDNKNKEISSFLSS